MGLYAEFGFYDPDEEDEGDGMDPAPWFPEEDDEETFDSLFEALYDATDKDGPCIAARGVCTKCGEELLVIRNLFRRGGKGRERLRPVWTIDGGRGCG